MLREWRSGKAAATRRCCRQRENQESDPDSIVIISPRGGGPNIRVDSISAMGKMVGDWWKVEWGRGGGKKGN